MEQAVILHHILKLRSPRLPSMDHFYSVVQDKNLLYSMSSLFLGAVAARGLSVSVAYSISGVNKIAPADSPINSFPALICV